MSPTSEPTPGPDSARMFRAHLVFRMTAPQANARQPIGTLSARVTAP